MSKGIILYQSKYGATKKYAQWLRDATGFDMVETKRADINEVMKYDTIILGGGVYASGIAGLSFLKKNISRLQGKRLAVFCAGASPYDEKAINQVRELHFKDDMSAVPLFYCRGAWDPDKMTFAHRTLCKMLQKAVAKKEGSEFEPWEAALLGVGDGKADWTEKSYLEPLIEYLRGEQ